MNKSRILLPIILFLFLFLIRCNKENERLEDYLVDFATRIHTQDGCQYMLDNNRVLIPSKEEKCDGPNNQRVILNYSFYKGDTIHVNSVSDIFTGSIFNLGNPEKINSDPVKIQSIWCSGGYLNMILETEYHSLPHKVGLYRDTTSQTVDLLFSYSRDGDPPGYQKKLYLSFSLDALKNETSPVNFRLFIHTFKGKRTLFFTLPE